jgi:photosystem II stability/assembly factor-like uncharacterized protein
LTIAVGRPLAASRGAPRTVLLLLAAASLAAAGWGAWWQPGQVDYGEVTFADRLFYPIETNHALGDPARASSVSFSANGRAGMVVVEQRDPNFSYARGALFRTDDGGARWRRLPTPVNAAPHGVGMSADGQRAVVYCEDGEVLRTEDGGATWSVHATGTTPKKDTMSGAGRVALSADGMRGLIVTGDASKPFLRTDDGGRTWTVRTGPGWRNPADSLPGQIAVSGDGQHVFISFALGPGLSRDGGATWTAITAGLVPTVHNPPLWSSYTRLDSVVLSADGRTAVAVAISTALAPDGRVREAVRHRNLVMRSDDGGETWAVVGALSSPDVPYLLLAPLALSGDGKRVMALQLHGAVQSLYVSDDRGATWTMRQIVNNAPGRHYDQVTLSTDGMHGIMIGEADPPIRRTSDGGLSWQPLDAPGRTVPYWSYGAVVIAVLAALALRRRA